MRVYLLYIFLLYFSFGLKAQEKYGVKLNLFEPKSQVDDSGYGSADIPSGIGLSFFNNYKNCRISINYYHYQIGPNKQIIKDFVSDQLSDYSLDNSYVHANSYNYKYDNGIYSNYPNIGFVRTNILNISGAYVFKWKRIILYPEIGIGTSYLNTWIPLDVFVKSKNSNNIKTIEYEPRSAIFNLSANASLNIEIRFSKYGIHLYKGRRYSRNKIIYRIQENSFHDTSKSKIKIDYDWLDDYFGIGIIRYFYMNTIKTRQTPHNKKI